METTEQPNQKEQLTVEELNIKILATTYEIIRSIEKDLRDNVAKARVARLFSESVRIAENIGTRQITEVGDFTEHSFMPPTRWANGTITCYRISCVYSDTVFHSKLIDK